MVISDTNKELFKFSSLKYKTKGDKFFMDLDFEKSLNYYEKSLQTNEYLYENCENSDRCDILYNIRKLYFKIGEVHVKLGNLKDALLYYKKYSTTGANSRENRLGFAKIYYLEYIDVFFSHKPIDFVKLFAKCKAELQNETSYNPIKLEETNPFEFLIHNLKFLKEILNLKDHKTLRFFTALEVISQFQFAKSPKVIEEIRSLNNFFNILLQNLVKKLSELSKQGFKADASHIIKKSVRELEYIRDSINESPTNTMAKSIVKGLLKFLDYNINYLKNPKKQKSIKNPMITFMEFTTQDISTDDLTMYRRIGMFYERIRIYDLALEFFKLYLEGARKEISVNYKRLAYTYKLISDICRKKGDEKNAIKYLKLMKNIGNSCDEKNRKKILTTYYFEYGRLFIYDVGQHKSIKKLLKLLDFPGKTICDRKIFKTIKRFYNKTGDKESEKGYDEICKSFINNIDNCNKSENENINTIKFFNFTKSNCKILSPLKIRKDNTNTMLLEENTINGKSFIVKYFKTFDKPTFKKVLKEFKFTRKFSKRQKMFVKLSGFFHRRYKDCDEVALRLEKCKCTLDEYFSDPENKIECKIIEAIKQLLKGFLIMKQSRVVHGDISPNNILVDNKNRVKIADFGSAHKVREADLAIKHSVAEGTPDFMSPEVYLCYCEEISNDINHDPFKSDVFSLGLSLLKSLGGNIEGLNKLESKDSNITRKIGIQGSVDSSRKIQEAKKRFKDISKKLEEKILDQINSTDLNENIKGILIKMLKVKNEERSSFDKLIEFIEKN